MNFFEKHDIWINPKNSLVCFEQPKGQTGSKENDADYTRKLSQELREIHAIICDTTDKTIPFKSFVPFWMIRNTSPVIVFPNTVPQQVYDQMNAKLAPVVELQTDSITTESANVEMEFKIDNTVQTDKLDSTKKEFRRLAEIMKKKMQVADNSWDWSLIKTEKTLLIPAKSGIKLLIRVPDNHSGLMQVVGSDALLLQNLVTTGKSVVQVNERCADIMMTNFADILVRISREVTIATAEINNTSNITETTIKSNAMRQDTSGL